MASVSSAAPLHILAPMKPVWQGSRRSFRFGSCKNCVKRLFWKGLRMGRRSRAGAIFYLCRRSLKNELRAAPCCGFTSSSAKEPFCQMFSRTASAPPEKLLLQRSQSHFQRSQSPAKQALRLGQTTSIHWKMFMLRYKPEHTPCSIYITPKYHTGRRTPHTCKNKNN